MEILIFVLGIQSGLLAAAAVLIVRQLKQQRAAQIEAIEKEKADRLEQQYANLLNFDGTAHSQKEIEN